MGRPLRLYDLFPGLEDRWPYEFIPGLGQGSDPATTWLDDINDAVSILDLRTTTSGDQVGFSCRFKIDPIIPGIEFGIKSIPNIPIRILELLDTKQGFLFVNIGPGGPDIIIEGLPVELRLPPDLIFGDPNPHTPENQDEDPDVFIGLSPEEILAEEAGFKNDPHAQYIVLRNDYSDNGGVTSVFTHLRLHITPDLDVELKTAAPISFGKCGFLNLPVLAIHDFQLIPSPALSFNEDRKLLDQANWIRHNILTPEGMGAIAMRSIEFNFETGYLKKAVPEDQKRDLKAEWVFEDIIFPLGIIIPFPVPVHFTVGFRRNVDNFNDPTDVFSFVNAATSFYFKIITVRIYNLYLQTIAGGLTPIMNIGFNTGDKEEAGEKETPWEIGIEWAENNTLRLGFTILPVEGYPSWLNWKFSDEVIVNLIKVTTGASIDKLRENASFGNYFECTGSFWIHDNKAQWNPDAGAPPISGNPPATTTPTNKANVKIDGPPDKPLSMIITNVGWRQGHIVVDKFSLPEGYSPRLGPLTIDLFEMGLLNENDAAYFSISGGFRFGEGVKVWEGGIWFKRMRFRIGGNTEAERFKMDGITGMLSVKDTLKIEIGGYYTDETNIPENYHKEEYGFTGRLELKLAKTWQFALDLITGRMTTLDTQESFRYFMMQFIVGHLPAGSCELLSIRGLLAINMAPKLRAEDEAQGPLKYYHWQKSIDPVTVPGSRRLEAWKAQDDAVCAGIGFAISINGLGDLCRLVAFFMYVKSPEDEEKGFVISIEAYFGKPAASNNNQRTPFAWGVLEYDLDNDIFAIQLGINLTLKTFVKNAPDTLADLFKVKGTLFIGNKPGTFAIGRLDDQKSWLMVQWDWDLFEVVKTYAFAAFCLELVAGGNKGVGFSLRAEGGIDAGFFGIYYYAGVTIVYRNFTTGSSDWAGLITADIGGYVKLFWAIRFGLDVHGEFRVINFDPTVYSALVRIRISTSWWLPNISWTLETSDGEVEPKARQMIGAPLVSATSFHSATGTNTALHAESLSTALVSLEDIDGLAIPEPARLQRLEEAISNPDHPLQPVATDSAIIVKFSNPLDQNLGIGEVNPEMGEQTTGDEDNHMKVRYLLTAIAVRRRARFGANRVWSQVEDHQQMEVISPETGEPVEGTITFEQTNLTYHWDPDKQEKNGTIPMNLVINSDTPFTFATGNMEADENLLDENPEWPCCRKIPATLHWYNYRKEPIGVLNRQLRRKFFVANGFEIITRDGIIVPSSVLTDGLVNVAAFVIEDTVQIMRMVFDDDAISAYLLVKGKIGSSITLFAENTQGETVLTVTHVFIPQSQPWASVAITGKIFRSVRVLGNSNKKAPWILSVDMAAWISASDYVRNFVNTKACFGINPNRDTDYSGIGGLFFLPNYEYEIALSSEISVKHNNTEWEKRNCTEYVYFITKGLPGLNYSENVGDEIKPYVQSAYPAMRPFIYAEEPVILVLNEKFKLSLPVSVRRPGDLEEHVQMMDLRLSVIKELDDKVISSVEEPPVDWITAKAESLVIILRGIFDRKIMPSRSSDLRIKRLAGLQAVSASGDCPGKDITLVNHTILVVYPTDRSIADKKYWTRNINCSAVMRLDNPVYINHPSFAETDLVAFTFSSNPAVWTVTDQKLSHAGSTSLQTAEFGEEDWNYFTLRTEIIITEGTAGIKIGKSSVNGPALHILATKVADGYQVAVYNSYPSGDMANVLIPTNEKIQMSISAYDDKISTTVNGETLVVQRGNARHGNCAFAVQGTAGFNNLFVESLDMYAFNFRVSRFDSFNSHIADFEPGLHKMNILSDAGFQNTLSDLRPSVDQVMQAGGDDTDRETLFTKLAAAGGLFIGQGVDKSRITAFITSGNNCAGLLLESPESLDVSTGELNLNLSMKFMSEEQGPLHTIAGLEAMLTAAKGIPIHVPFHEIWTFKRIVKSVKVGNGPTVNVKVILPVYTNPLITLAGKSILWVEYNHTDKQMAVYAGQVTNFVRITVTLKGTIPFSLGKLPGFAGTKAIRLLLVPSVNVVCYGDINREINEWRESPTTILQNHDATKLLLLPLQNGSFFDPGQWKLSFSLKRTRYDTTDNTDILATYQGEEQINFEID